MKKIEILNLNQILSSMKLNKLDKESRGVILSNHLKTYKIAKDISESIEEMRKKLVEGHEEEIALLEKYRSEFRSADKDSQMKIIEKIKNECLDALTVEQEFSEFQNKLLGEDVEIEINKLNKEVFLNCCAESDINITAMDIINLEYLFVE